jgi:pantoate--beta-alanine ligase
MRSETVYLALGSNVGDRRAHLDLALQRLAAVPGIEVVRCSSAMETALVGAGPPQGMFLNAVAELRTSLPASALLAVCKELERAAGRVLPSPANHPRPLDLDILFYGSDRIETRDLVVPHPRLHEREFVTLPLAELGVDLAALPGRELPQVVRVAEDLSARVQQLRQGGLTVGMVPTMGALHAGHESLLRVARRECDVVLATIFVNPLQFGPNEDFAAYPRTFERDLQVCREAGVDMVFAPSPEGMYPPGFCSRIAVGEEAETMEGAVRDGHFSGVATVVARLFALGHPHRAYFGRKDAQQVAVIRRMAVDLGFVLQIVECPIVREPDGLALSSRNVFLSAEDRRAAVVLHDAMLAARAAFVGGERDRDRLLAVAQKRVDAEPRAELDYLELRREGDLQPLSPGPVAGGRMLVAAKFQGGQRPVRLLDNLSLDPGKEPPLESSASAGVAS